MRTSIAYGVTCLVFAAPCIASVEVNFYTSRAQWLEAVGGPSYVAEWSFHPAVLDAAYEVPGRPAADADLGNTLTFGNVPLPFTLRCMQPGAHFIYRDVHLSPAIRTGLSIGRAGVHHDDDLEISFPDACVRAAAFHTFHSGMELGEQVRVYDIDGFLLKTYQGIPAFLGITANTLIGRIEIDEDPSGDDIGTTGIEVVDCWFPAAVRALTDKEQWRHAADIYETSDGLPANDFVLCAEALAGADEWSTLPPCNADMVSTLSFLSFTPPFALQTLQPGAVWVFDDSAWSSAYRPLLSVGRSNVHEDDDFVVYVGGCTPAAGLELFDNTTITDEAVMVYGWEGQLVGMLEFPGTGSDRFAFMGVIAPCPIDRLEFDEDTGGDDIAIRDVSFLAPLAATPASLDVCENGEAWLTLASAMEIYDLQWRKDGELLYDGPTEWGSYIMGAFSPTLVVFGVSQPDAGLYDCQVQTMCGTMDSVLAAVRVCTADFDCTGFVDTDDFTAFVIEFEMGNQSTDVDGSGFVDTDDFTFFVLAFVEGC